MSVDLKLDIDDNSESDSLRREEPWTNSHEEYFYGIIGEARSTSKLLNRIMKKNKKLYKLFSFPSVILPLMLSILDKHIGTYEYIRIGILLVLCIVNSVMMINNYGKKYTTYNEYSAKYSELANMVEIELIKKKKYRIQVDVYTENIKNKWLTLNSQCPDT